MPPTKQLSLLEMFGKEVKKEVTKRVVKRRALNESTANVNVTMDGASSSKRALIAALISSPSSPTSTTSNEHSKIANDAKETSKKPEEDIPVENCWPTAELAPLFSTLVDPSWRTLLEPELKKDYVKGICKHLEKFNKKGATIFPPRPLIFNAFNLTPFNQIRVVLIGQDPYHDDHQAHGLCFSVPNGVKPPPSLRNMFKELSAEYPGFVVPNHGCLESWAKQGIFLLNATLTVEAHQANSHQKIGWQQFTDSVIRLVSQRSERGVVFLLLGGFAQRKEALVDTKKHRVIKAAHPSPLSAYKFFGSKCFSKINAKLQELGHPPIDWTAL